MGLGSYKGMLSACLGAVLWLAAQGAHAEGVANATPAANVGTVASIAAPMPAPAPAAIQIDFQGQPASDDARRIAQWAFQGRDAKGRPVAIVDKKNARIFVFDGEGQLRGSTPVLLGYAVGDTSAPGIGKKAGGYIHPTERTTPAGRFDSEPGHNIKGEAIVWVDYDAAFAIHRLRPAHPAERRPERLASPTPDDNRISQGCVIVAGAFFDQVVAPTLGKQRGVVYVLPDQQESFASVGLKAGPL